jgi:nicotinic acid phosphoribosyltransferase
MDFRVFILRHLDLLNALGFWTIRVLFPRSVADSRDAYRNAAHELLAKPLTLAAHNTAYGMGGGLLQKVDRDTERFAMKCSAQERDGQCVKVQKNPLDKSKASLLAVYRS